MAKKTIIGDLDVQGAIKHNGQEISYEGGGGIPDIRSQIINYGRVSVEDNHQRIAFPSDILPLRLTDNNLVDYYDKTFLFNYKSNKILLPNGFIVGYLQYNSDENRIEAFINVDPDLIEDNTKLEVDFILHNGQITLDNLMNVSNLYIDEKTAPLQAGLSFKSGITTNDVHIQYKMMQMDGGTEETYDSDAGSTKFATITDFKYIDGVPAILNPSPDGGGDLWYKYVGTETIDGVTYDKWFAEHNEDQSSTYYALSNRIVETKHTAYKHNITVELEGSGGDKRCYITIFNSLNRYMTMQDLMECIGHDYLVGDQIMVCDDVNAKYYSMIVEEYWDYKPGDVWKGYTLSGHGTNSSTSYEINITEDGATSITTDNFIGF